MTQLTLIPDSDSTYKMSHGPNERMSSCLVWLNNEMKT